MVKPSDHKIDKQNTAKVDDEQGKSSLPAQKIAENKGQHSWGRKPGRRDGTDDGKANPLPGCQPGNGHFVYNSVVS